ncbi:hypothetical protein L6164_034092 [Bauhinia variegata]|uniref:Uncharacterized protein n=1 Tax=Bauhinia variegata TaxID=167791 RepID=A0ACB9KTN7_BAUVA|nr:hypothetical protein L6164_034092 [Bauhinia variegata]
MFKHIKDLLFIGGQGIWQEDSKARTLRLEPHHYYSRREFQGLNDQHVLDIANAYSIFPLNKRNSRVFSSHNKCLLALVMFASRPMGRKAKKSIYYTFINIHMNFVTSTF